jgi:hypothetical protein
MTKTVSLAHILSIGDCLFLVKLGVKAEGLTGYHERRRREASSPFLFAAKFSVMN